MTMTLKIEDRNPTFSYDTPGHEMLRPVAQLPFISKILEKVVLIKLKQHLSSNNLLEMCQSAYRKDR